MTINNLATLDNLLSNAIQNWYIKYGRPEADVDKFTEKFNEEEDEFLEAHLKFSINKDILYNIEKLDALGDMAFLFIGQVDKVFKRREPSLAGLDMLVKIHRENSRLDDLDNDVYGYLKVALKKYKYCLNLHKKEDIYYTPPLYELLTRVIMSNFTKKEILDKGDLFIPPAFGDCFGNIKNDHPWRP